MSPELVFSLSSSAILPGWLLLVLAPRWSWTLGLISTVLIPGALGLVYASLFLSQLPVLPEGGGFGSLAEVQILFSNPYLLTAGWVHYFAFDLFIGAWELRDSQRLGIHHAVMLPCLLLTLMLGPSGLLLYLIIRGVKRKSLWLDDAMGAASPDS